MSKENSHIEPNSIKSQLSGKTFFVLDILIVLVFNFVVFILIRIFIPDEFFQGVNGPIIVYSIKLISILVGSFTGLFVIQKVFYDKDSSSGTKTYSAVKEITSLFRINKKNIKHQIIHTILLLFLIYIPLDLLAYIIPGMLKFSADSLLSSQLNQYIANPNFFIFIGFSVFIHLTVAFGEELFFRGVSVTRGKNRFGKIPSVMVSSIAFGLFHFAYIFGSDDIASDFIPALIWGLTAFLIGSISALYLIKTRFILPLIFCHAINNIISSIALWRFQTQGSSVLDLSVTLYLPFLIVSIILAIIFKSKIKFGLSSYSNLFQTYSKSLGNKNKDKIVIFFIDIGIAFLFWVIGYMLL
jgi:membrane protease YdiL (CAAX protease family)